MKTLTRFLAFVLSLTLALFAFEASAQDVGARSSEPSVAQIYQAANSGNLDRANALIDEVLKAHPGSAKAHYVKAEVSARAGKYDVARQELANAEKIAPGLPFAKADSVQALRNQLANANAATPRTPAPTRQMGAPADAGTVRPAAAAAAARPGFPWGTLAIVAAIVVIGVMVLRRRTPPPVADGYAAGYGNSPAAPYGPAGYGPAYPPGAAGPQPGYPAQPSMGSSLARGLGTGLAVGAGVVAAQEIGRHMFGHGDAHAASSDPGQNPNPPTLDQIDEGMRHNLNTDMGGNDFGVNDGGSWDDAGGGGGGDWDT
jgi:hypothetical protein